MENLIALFQFGSRHFAGLQHSDNGFGGSFANAAFVGSADYLIGAAIFAGHIALQSLDRAEAIVIQGSQFFVINDGVDSYIGSIGTNAEVAVRILAAHGNGGGPCSGSRSCQPSAGRR